MEENNLSIHYLRRHLSFRKLVVYQLWDLYIDSTTGCTLSIHLPLSHTSKLNIWNISSMRQNCFEDLAGWEHPVITRTKQVSRGIINERYVANNQLEHLQTFDFHITYPKTRNKKTA
jgi:hypothetical protein